MASIGSWMRRLLEQPSFVVREIGVIPPPRPTSDFLVLSASPASGKFLGKKRCHTTHDPGRGIA